uniref:Lysophospholipid acyltransferase 5 n=1 Tax=Rhabditophanes sp. KR3021 TaxID=114890 RepID=A0AC35U665_9BILA
MGVVSDLAEAVNFNEDGLRLLLCILASYPFGAIYRTFFYNKSVSTQHIFFIITGVLMYLFNSGLAILHTFFAIGAAYVLIHYFANNKNLVYIAHGTFMGHLLVGYWFSESEEYDINWTTPYCIMVLRMIGLCLDVHDGTVDIKKLSGDALKNNIKTPPSLLEIAAYAFYIPFTMAGPVVPLNYFRQYVAGQHLTKEGTVRGSSLMVSIRRFIAGVVFCVLNQWGSFWISNAFFNTSDYYNLQFIYKVTWTTIWFRSSFYKYGACWLLGEGGSILAGMGYMGKDAEGKDLWHGARNINIRGFFLGSDYNSVVESFNIGTNTFAKNHVFKRLRFLGNKTVSQAATLMYLAMWHGYHVGYFLLFAYEMLSMMSQDQLYSIIPRVPGLRASLDKWYVKPFTWLFGKVIITTTMGFAFLTFGLIKTKYWWDPLIAQYAWGYILYIVIWPITFQILKKMFPKPKEAKKID